MKAKKFLLTITLLALTIFIKAQDKYDFVIITYFPNDKLMTVAINGKEVLTENVDVGRFEQVSGNPLLKKVNEYQANDWEIITFTNTNMQGGHREFFAYMKKKKIQSK